MKSTKNRIAAIALISLATLPNRSISAPPKIEKKIFEGKSAACIARFKKSNAGFCKIVADEDAAWATGIEQKLSRKEVTDILWVLNEVAYSCNFEPIDMKSCKRSAIAPQFGGIGMTFQKEVEGSASLRVMEVFIDEPANLAGLRAGDIIVKIDDQITSSMSADDARAVLRGPPGSLVRLEILREPDADTKLLEIRRELIKRYK